MGMTEDEAVHCQSVFNMATKEMREFGCVGAGIGSGFAHTNELRPMKFDEAMATAGRPK